MKIKYFVFLLLTTMFGVNLTSCREENDEPKLKPVLPIIPNTEIDIFADLGKDEMVFIEGGTFMMGAQNESPTLPNFDSDAQSNEQPVHQVTLNDFYIGKYEVTNELWEYVMENSYPSYFGGENAPVECVDMLDCQEFIGKLNSMTGKSYRLPTEAEWEYVARGGNKSQNNKYSGSNILDDVAWNFNNSLRQTHTVGTKKSNELGVYDMNGNVYEWCSDLYGSYSSLEQINPTGPESGNYYVVRGGSWHEETPTNYRVSYRKRCMPRFCNTYIGLRLVLDVQ